MKDADDRRRRTAAALLLAMPLLLTACATAPAPRSVAYADARAACEFMRGGRPGTERRSAEGGGASARIAACLQRRGWHADGTPTLEQLLRDMP